jgi:GTP-binding protein
VVAIVGRPNVGKSRLFNRFVGERRSIVADQPGVTRDRIYAEAELSGATGDVEVVLVDTGGFDPESADPIMRRVLEQSELAVDEADVIVLVTDGRAGVLPEDLDVARLLRKSGKPVMVAVNKLDGPQQDDLLHEFHQLGIPEILPISAAHGRNVGELEELLVESLPPPEDLIDALEELPEPGEDPIEVGGPVRVAVIGRPNAGKSSLVNRLIGEDRHLVSEVAGTTVDSIDSLFEYGGERFLFVDTAGIRRKRSIVHRVERFSVFAALKGLERSDVALLLLDATQDIAAQDAKVAAFAHERGKAVVLVVSKWDRAERGLTTKAHVQKLREALPHLAYAPVVHTSAHTGMGVDKLLPTVRRIHREYAQRIPTGELNRFVEGLMERHPPPSKKGRQGRIYYITQVDVRPPRFLASVNDPELIHFSYRRFLVNEIRRTYGYAGVPLLVGYRSHKRDRAAKGSREKGATAAAQDQSKQATAQKRARKKAKTGSGSPAAKPRGGRRPSRKTSIKRR